MLTMEFLSEVEAAAVAAGFNPRLPGVKELEAIEAAIPGWDWSAQGETIRLLEEGSASEEALSSILKAIPTKSTLPHFRPHLERLLQHPSPMIRRQALRVLGWAWMEDDRVPVFLEMLQNDPDESVRSAAAFSIGVIRRDSKDRALLGDLAALLPDCPDGLRVCVYQSLLAVAGRQSKSSEIGKPSGPGIDWKLVESFTRQED